MKSYLMTALMLVAAGSLQADSRIFSASDVPAARIKPGRVVVQNNSTHITAYRFIGNIREALFSLRSSHAIAKHSYGNVLFQSNANVPTAVPAVLADAIREAAAKHGVDPRLVAAVARRESAFNPKAVSRVGAVGLMQLMPETARYLGVNNVYDARENLLGGARYLRTLLDTFNGDLDLTLAAYNAGPGAVQKYNGIPPYRETKAYVAAVRATYEASLR